jgi:hypothetical protein
MGVMNPALLQQPFFQVTLPLVVTFVAAIWAATWSQNKRFEDWKKVLEDLKTDMNRQFTELRAEMTRRFDKRDTKLEDHDERIVRLEERISPITGRR